MSSPIVRLESVCKEYPGDPPTPALRDIDLTLEAGELAAVVGPSGSGKSTLLHIIGTLDGPTSGAVHIAGCDTSQLTDDDLAALRAREIGFVFQQFYLLSGMSAVDNVADGMLYGGQSLAQRRRIAAEALEQVGLGHRLDHDPSQLSGGERQRVAIARALIGRPSVVLADEPTGNLDSHTSESILALLHDLNSGGVTILVITHDRDIAAQLPRRIALLDGRISSDTAAPATVP